MRNLTAGAVLLLAVTTAGCGGGLTTPASSGTAGGGSSALGSVAPSRQVADLAPAPVATPTSFDLGGVCLFSVLVFNEGANLLLDDNSVINGTAGLDNANAHMQLHSGTVTGNVYLLTDSDVNNILNQSAIVLGTQVDPVDLATAGSDGNSVSAAMAALPSSPGTPSTLISHGQKGIPYTITAGAGLTIVNVDRIDLQNSSLTVNAPVGAQVVINVAGQVLMQNTPLLVTGGIQPGRVAINATGSAQNVSVTNPDGSATPFGALVLAPNRTVFVEGTAIQGALVAGKIEIKKGSSVTQGSSCPSSDLPI